MKVKVSTILPNEEKEGANAVDQRNGRDSKRKRSESSISDVQLHQIKSTTLRTTANNFFGTASHSNSSPMSSSDGSRTPRESAGEIKSRSQLMQSLDPIVMSFNAADFETLAKSIRAICAKGVSLSCKLIPDPITNDDNVDIVDIDEFVFPEPPAETVETFHHNLTGVSALLLLWVLLHETHPDAVMQIIDRRICYRQVLPLDRPVASSSTSDESVIKPVASGKSTHARKISVPPVVTQPPVSIIEAVLKFSGSCITSRSLDALFADLSQRGGILLPHASTTLAPSPSAASTGSTSSNSTGGSTVAVVGATGLKLNPNALAEYISNYLTHEAWCDSDVVSSLEVAAHAPAVASVVRPNAFAAKQGAQGSLGTLLETSRKYLADVRLVFNEHDLVTRFEFNIRAAEDFTQSG